jgi:hypothetical protein
VKLRYTIRAAAELDEDDDDPASQGFLVEAAAVGRARDIS